MLLPFSCDATYLLQGIALTGTNLPGDHKPNAGNPCSPLSSASHTPSRAITKSESIVEHWPSHDLDTSALGGLQRVLFG